MDHSDSRSSVVVCRVSSCLIALSLTHVWETMRPLPIQPISVGPDFILGLSVVRGSPIPVIDARRLLMGRAGEMPFTARFVTLRLGSRRAALVVDAVVGVRTIGAFYLQACPPLLRESHIDIISAIGRLDDELLLVVESTRILPASFLGVPGPAAMSS